MRWVLYDTKITCFDDETDLVGFPGTRAANICHGHCAQTPKPTGKNAALIFITFLAAKNGVVPQKPTVRVAIRENALMQ